jgi:hypothetical protein
MRADAIRPRVNNAESLAGVRVTVLPTGDGVRLVVVVMTLAHDGHGRVE